jgi:hypothetical protein
MNFRRRICRHKDNALRHMQSLAFLAALSIPQNDRDGR